MTWTKKTPENAELIFFLSVAFGNHQFVIVSSGGSIITSTDGTAWKTQGCGPYPLESVTFVNNQFVAVGYKGTIVTSTDGVVWSEKSSGTENTLEFVTYANNQYIAVGQEGTILTSTDGTTWIPEFSGTIYRLSSIICDNNQLVAVGLCGTILVSKFLPVGTDPGSKTDTSISPSDEKPNHRCGCGAGTGLALLPPIGFKIGAWRKKKKKELFLHRI